MSSLDLSSELRGTDSAARLTGLEQRLKDPDRIEARVEAAVRLGTVSVWRAPGSGELFEVQFHTPLSHSVRERSFPLYARLRSAEPDDAMRTELQALSRALCWSGPPGPPDQPSRPGGMPHRVAYYAIIDALSSRDSPAGVLRRVMHPGGQRDEAFGHDLAWRHTFLLYSAERGNLDNKLRQINGIEAARTPSRRRGCGRRWRRSPTPRRSPSPRRVPVRRRGPCLSRLRTSREP